MQLHELKPTHKNKSKKRVGRGGRKGTYSGRGMKGQTSRAGRKMVPIIREIIKRYPKLKGYRRFVFENKTAIINLGVLEETFKDGDLINPKILVEKGVINSLKGKVPEVKILGNGKISKKITVENCKLSKSAKAAIEKSGGNIK